MKIRSFITVFKLFIAVLLNVIVSHSYANTDLLNHTQQAQAEQRRANQQREAAFLATQQQYRELRDHLLARKAALEVSIDTLSEQFTTNEQQLAQQEQTLHQESGSLGELLSVARQATKAFQAELSHVVTAIDNPDDLNIVTRITDATTLPSRQQLYSLWYAFQHHLQKSAELTRLKVAFVNHEGVIHSKEVMRLGAFGLFDENGYLIWSENERRARPYPVQPELAPTFSLLPVFSSPPALSSPSHSPSLQDTTMPLMAFDPLNGRLLEQLSLTPTLTQRIEQGGVIAKVILGLLIVGLMIGVTQGSILFISRIKIQAQLDKPQNSDNNALGRILSVYKGDNSLNVEALELRLYEAVLDEQQTLERGLPMLKLLAALSPMLGLLGTVTGMIETFQVMSQYGNADPRIMASGISTALITTVLGLVAAMPLLFIHNILSSVAENIRTLLEKQGVALVAQRAEQEPDDGMA